MRILHYIPKNDSMITSYVDMLVNSMGLGAENIIVDAETAAKEKLQSAHFDILHIHGCWHYSAYRVLKLALKKGTRMVLSPYGQLEPWILEEHYWKDKLPKKMLFQKDIVERAYAVIIQGKMEEECIETGMERPHGDYPQPCHHPLHHTGGDGAKDLPRLSEGTRQSHDRADA